MVVLITSTKKSPEVVAAVTHAVVQEAIGLAGGPLRQEAQYIIADTFFSNAHTAYIAKSHGLADEFGDRWKPLARRTVEQKLGIAPLSDPGTPGEISPSVTGGTAFIPDASRRAEWFDRQGRLQAQLISGGMSPEDARTKANTLAWGPNLAAGGVPINVDTGLLANSLSPGDEYKPGQVRQFYANVGILGSEVDYAANVHKVRPILPTADKAVVWVRRGLAIVANMIRNEIVDRLRS